MTLTSASLTARPQNGAMADHESNPAAKPTRRSFTAAYKADIIAEYDSYPRGSDQRGAILRREGLYSSHLSEWRKQAKAGARQGLAAKSKQRRSVEAAEVEKLRKQNARLEAELLKTQTALEITGKVHALLEQLSESADTEPPSMT